MAKGNMLLGMARKKVGDLVFYRANGEQITRARNRNPRNPKSAKQSVQRMVLATASKLASVYRPLINHSWEGIQVGGASVRHFQQKVMQILRDNAAYVINGGDDVVVADYVIKGAPVPGAIDNMPISTGNLPMHDIIVGNDEIRLVLSSALAESISSQTEYIAELAKLGLEPGDQLTIVMQLTNLRQVVASYGNEVNCAQLVRYARVTFTKELPTNFSGGLISGEAFNPALIESSEGVWPAIDTASTGTAQHIVFAPSYEGFNLMLGGLIRSQYDSNRKIHYSNSYMKADGTNFDVNNASGVWPSYGENATEVNVGDELYLRNAIAAASTAGGTDTPKVAFSFEFPISVTALDNQTITFADIADLTNLRLVNTGDDELSFVNGELTDGSDSYATTTIAGNVVTLHVTVTAGPTLKDYTWSE